LQTKPHCSAEEAWASLRKPLTAGEVQDLKQRHCNPPW